MSSRRARSASLGACFFLPRWTPEGALNGIRLQRLKDKLGDRSNAGNLPHLQYRSYPPAEGYAQQQAYARILLCD